MADGDNLAAPWDVEVLPEGTLLVADAEASGAVSAYDDAVGPHPAASASTTH